MKVLIQALSLASLVLFTSCSHFNHGSCCGDNSQCEMHKDKKDKSCCKDKDQCPMKKDEKKEEAKK